MPKRYQVASRGEKFDVTAQNSSPVSAGFVSRFVLHSCRKQAWQTSRTRVARSHDLGSGGWQRLQHLISGGGATRSTQQARWWCYNRHDIYAADAMRQAGRSVLAMLALLRSARPLVPKQAVRCLARRPVKKRPTISMALCAAASHASNLISRAESRRPRPERARRCNAHITQARPARRPKTRTNCTTAAKREDHPAVAESRRGSGRGR